MDEKKEISFNEQRIREITRLYYSRPEIQKAIFDFSANREVVPRYFEGFGKRPDSLEYPGDIFEIVKKGATSFHCSEELWKNPLELSTELSEKQLNELRIGWDLLIDIDSKYIDYSKISAELIMDVLKFHGIENIGIKFSGNKGFHIIIPWKAFPKEMNQIKTSDMFPQWARIITYYLIEQIRKDLTKKINELGYENLKNTSVQKYIKRERGIFKGDISPIPSTQLSGAKIMEFNRDILDIEKDEESWNKQVMPDIILVSSRHLFRAPYSLHEKTSLASVVIDKENILQFQLTDANPLKVKPKKFMPNAEENEAKELLIQALDWHKEKNPDEKEKTFSEKIFKPIKISLDNLSEKNFPPSIQKILQGLSDGRKRALFILINFFRSVGVEKDELEKRIYEWNKKNYVPLKEGYIKSQLFWSYRNKVVPPPNFDKDYYKGIGIAPTEEEIRFKNPVNYVVRKVRRGK